MKRIIAILTLMAIAVSCMTVISFAEETVTVTEVKGVASVGNVSVYGENDRIGYSAENLYSCMGNDDYIDQGYGVIRYALSKMPENQDEYWFTVGGNKVSETMYGNLREKVNFEFGIYEVKGVTDTWVNESDLTPSKMSATGDKTSISFELISTTTSENDEEIVKAESINTTQPNYYNGYRVRADISSYMKARIAEFKASGKEEEYVTLAIRPTAFYNWETGEEIKGFYQPVFKHVGHGDIYNMYPRIRAITYDAPVTNENIFYETDENGNIKFYVFGSVPEGIDIEEAGIIYSTSEAEFEAEDVDGVNVRKLRGIPLEEKDWKFGVGVTDKRESLPSVAYARSYFKTGNVYKYGDVIKVNLAAKLIQGVSNASGLMYPEAYSSEYSDYYVTTEDGTFDGIMLDLAPGAEILEEKKATKVGETTEITVARNGVASTLKFHYVDRDEKGSVVISKSGLVNGYSKDATESLSVNSSGTVLTKSSFYMIDRKTGDDNIAVMEFDISDVNMMSNTITVQLSGYNLNNNPCGFDVYVADVADDYVWTKDDITYNNSITSGNIVKREKIATPDIAKILEQKAEITSGSYYTVEGLKINVTDAVREAKLKDEDKITLLLETNGSYWAENPDATASAYTFYLTNAYAAANKPVLSWEYIEPPVYVPFPDGVFESVSYPFGVMYPETYNKEYDDYYLISANGKYDGISYKLLEGLSVVSTVEAEKAGDTAEITVANEKGETKTVKFHFVDEEKITEGSSTVIDSAYLHGSSKDLADSVTNTGVKKTSQYMVSRKSGDDNIALYEFDISDINIMTNKVMMQLVGYNRTNKPNGFDVYAAELKDGYDWDVTTVTYNNSINAGNIVKGELLDSADMKTAVAQVEAITSGNYYTIDEFKLDITKAVRKAKLDGKSTVTILVETNDSYWNENPDAAATAAYTFYLTNAYTAGSVKPSISWEFTPPAPYEAFPDGAFETVNVASGEMYPETYSKDCSQYFLTVENGSFDGINYVLNEGVSVVSESYATAVGETTEITVANEDGATETVRFTYIEKSSNANGIFSSASAGIDEYLKDSVYSYSGEARKTTFWMSERKLYGDAMGLLEFDISDVCVMSDRITLHLAGKTRTNLPVEFAVYATDVKDDYAIDPTTVTFNNSLGSGNVVQASLLATFDPDAIKADIDALNAIGSGNYYKTASLEADVTEAVKKAKCEGKDRIVFLIRPTGKYWETAENDTTRQFYIVNAYGDYPANRNYAPTLSWVCE